MWLGCYPGCVGKQDDRQVGIVAALVRSVFLVNGVYAESAREQGLTPQQGQLLCVLMPKAYGMSELGAALRLAKSSLTGLVDRTERNGLVRREPDPQDTRAVRVTLTTRGSRIAEEFYAGTCRRVEGLLAGLTDAERGTLAGLLGRVVMDNNVPLVFLERGEAASAPHRH
jgi:DNA-binding MarR family transcriptional regulator